MLRSMQKVVTDILICPLTLTRTVHHHLRCLQSKSKTILLLQLKVQDLREMYKEDEGSYRRLACVCVPSLFENGMSETCERPPDQHICPAMMRRQSQRD